LDVFGVDVLDHGLIVIAAQFLEMKKVETGSQSYQTLISSFFRFSLLSLSACSTGKYCLYIKMAKLDSQKQKKFLFYEEKSLVGLTPWLNFFKVFYGL
jgi:hypothetical protein